MKIVLDIETVPLPLESFDDTQKAYLFRDIPSLEIKSLDGSSTFIDNGQLVGEKHQTFGLSPMTGKIVCIGMYDAEENVPLTTYVLKPDLDPENHIKNIVSLDDDSVLCYYKTEKELLQAFVNEIIRLSQLRDNSINGFVTFNGRNFDMPFIMIRCALNGVNCKPNLMNGTKFNPLVSISPKNYTYKHFDLAEILTFYGFSGGSGMSATKRFSLDFYTRSFGIKSPKEEGVSGSDVSRMFDEGSYREIAEYCNRDIKATAELFNKLEDTLPIY